VSSYTALSAAVTRAHVRDRVTLFFTFVFPLIFLVVFGLLFDGVAGRKPIDFLAPGVLSWAVANGAVFGVAYTLVQWRDSGVLRLIRMTPTSVLTVLGSRFLVAVGVALAQIVVFVGVAMLPPFGLRPGPYALLALPVLVAGVMAFFALGMIIGSHVTSSEAVAAIANCLLVPMAFLSGTFYPLDQSPAWLRAVAQALPLKYMVDGTAGVLTGSRGPGSVAVPIAVLLGTALLVVGFATRLFRWGADA
jgi:ABC-2 type transport system permease protein